MAYEQADRPVCLHCGEITGKRAVFWDRFELRPLCAMCAVAVTGVPWYRVPVVALARP